MFRINLQIITQRGRIAVVISATEDLRQEGYRGLPSHASIFPGLHYQNQFEEADVVRRDIRQIICVTNLKPRPI
jgi:hypothetical protein